MKKINRQNTSPPPTVNTLRAKTDWLVMNNITAGEINTKQGQRSKTGLLKQNKNKVFLSSLFSKIVLLSEKALFWEM